MKIEFECSSEIVEEMVVQSLTEQLEYVRHDYARLKGKKKLTKAQKEDKEYDKKMIKALRWVISHYSVPTM